MLRDDVEESLFRWIESIARDPVWQRRFQAASKATIRMAIRERKRGREWLYTQLVESAERWGRFRGPRLARELGVDVEDPRSLGKIQDWEDALFGVTGHWTEEGVVDGARCATKHETACPFADIAREDTRICTDFVHRLESETFRAVQPRYRLVPLDRLLSRGDRACEFRHEIPLRPEAGAEARAD